MKAKFGRGIFFLALISILSWLTVRPVGAVGEFETSYEVTYTVAEDGWAKVQQKVALTNLTQAFYASEHTLNVGEGEIKEVWAQDPSGGLKPEIINQDGEQIIKVVFGAPVAGEGKTLNWELGYETKVARQIGRLWRIDLPRIGREAWTSTRRASRVAGCGG